MTSLGAEICGWTRAYELEKADARYLRTFLRVRRRPKNEALWWLLGIYPPWVATRKRAFDFLCGILEHGDSLERAALEQWWCLFDSHGVGWIAEFVAALIADSALDAWGGIDAIRRWDWRAARAHQQEYCKRCEHLAIQRMKVAVGGGKHAWLLRVIPEWSSPRPLDVIACGNAGRVLLRWLLSEHNLEVEVGRHARVAREVRWCKRCLRETATRVLGDEAHCLSTCVRAEAQRTSCILKLRGLFAEAQRFYDEEWHIMCFVEHIGALPTRFQNRLWRMFSAHLAEVESVIAAEAGNT